MLRGDRVVLAPLKDEDLPVLFGWINERDEVLANSPYAPVHARNHEEWFASVRQRPDVAIFAVRLLDDERLVGTCQLRGIDSRARSAELQIRIGAPDARDAGYGTEALRLLLEHAFGDLNLRRVYLHAFATNERAVHVYEKLGFQVEGRLREAAYLDGAFVDVLVLGLLREEAALS